MYIFYITLACFSSNHLFANQKLFGWLKDKAYTSTGNTFRLAAIIIIHTQVLLGVTLYVINPIVRYFLTHFKEAIHEKEFRFFGMKHLLIMLITLTCVL